MGAPQVGPGGKGLEHFLMVVVGVLLGVVVVVRIGGVPLEDILRAVLGDTQAAVRVHGVELIHPGTVVLHIANVPAEIVVVGQHIGDGDVLRVHRHHGNLRHGGQAAGIQLLAQGVQIAQVAVQSLALAGDGDFV